MGELIGSHGCGVDPGGQVQCLLVAHRQAEPPRAVRDRYSERRMGKQRVAEIKQHPADFHVSQSTALSRTSLPES